MKTILFAEPDVIVRALFEKSLKEQDFLVQTVEDGEQAIDAIKAKAPDLLICEIQMPKVDGFQVLRALPKESRTFPIVILTNFNGEDFRLRAQELGADDYILKSEMTIKSLKIYLASYLMSREAVTGRT